MESKVEVRIVYCKPCGFQGRALELANAILTNYGGKGVVVTLVPGTNGIFDVYINNELVFSRYREKRFPEHGEVMSMIERRLG
jgi:selT/selW/selH-like putative selenoprotein